MDESKSQYKKKQHYIPQFALKFFVCNDNKLHFTYTQSYPIKLLKLAPLKVMQENNFYEFINEDDYILRNALENSYSFLESNVSLEYKEFVEMSKQNDFQKKFINLINGDKWENIQSKLLLYTATLLLRGKAIKELVYSKDQLDIKQKCINYLLLTTNAEYTAKYAKELYSGHELTTILAFLKEYESKSASVVWKTFLDNFQIKIYQAKGGKKFFLADNPVIIDKMQNKTDYYLPLSPDICIGLHYIKEQSANINVENIYSWYDDDVNKINEQSVRNTHNTIIIYDDMDLEFVRKILNN